VIEPASAAEALRVLDHHGPEVVPVMELVAGGGVSLAAGLLVARWNSVMAWFSKVRRRRAARFTTEEQALDGRRDPSPSHPRDGVAPASARGGIRTSKGTAERRSGTTS
jgi:hypothetical protein